MSEENDRLDELYRYLKQQRDELRLRMHLAGKDAKDEFSRLEVKWKELEQKAEPLADAAKEAAEEAQAQAKSVASAALDVAARELKSGYEKLQAFLKD